MVILCSMISWKLTWPLLLVRSLLRHPLTGPSMLHLLCPSLPSLHTQLDLNLPLDAAVFACLTTTFWSAACLGEFTVKKLTAFNPAVHISHDMDRNGNVSMVFYLPRTKCAPVDGEDMYWAHQSGPANQHFALENHQCVNAPCDDKFLFSYQHAPSGKHHPLTQTAFLDCLKKATATAGLEPLQGHGLRIGAVLEYLLCGVPFAVVKALGRWSSEAFVRYLQQHAKVLLPYIQDSPCFTEFNRIAMNISPVCD